MIEDAVFIPSVARTRRKYLTTELLALARLDFAGVAESKLNALMSSPDDAREHALLLSLERFELAEYGRLERDGRHAGWGWRVTNQGRELLATLRPTRFGCRCKHAIRLPCVCAEKTACPNPAHGGNGCHGTHD